MRYWELKEAEQKKIVAVMPGGFHPFHPGHKSLYDWAVKTFGQDSVYVAATDDTKSRPFPFAIKQKLAGMAGVPGDKFIQVKSPFNALSYQGIIGNPTSTSLIFIRSKKDEGTHPLPDQIRKSDGLPGYLISYKGKDQLETADSHAHIAYGPTINFDFAGMQIKSATELRNTWPTMSEEDKHKAAELMYGAGHNEAVALLDQALGAPIGESLNEFFWGDGDPLPEPEWMDDNNRLLWQQKGPTTKDKRLVAQLRRMEQMAQNDLVDMANQNLKTELEMLED